MDKLPFELIMDKLPFELINEILSFRPPHPNSIILKSEYIYSPNIKKYDIEKRHNLFILTQGLNRRNGFAGQELYNTETDYWVFTDFRNSIHLQGSNCRYCGNYMRTWRNYDNLPLCVKCDGSCIERRTNEFEEDTYNLWMHNQNSIIERDLNDMLRELDNDDDDLYFGFTGENNTYDFY